ncbi:MAG: hypothetical protein IJG38_03310, partial [Thermoguttaceae bacterium]|nr:hypothetical protein [Thermoguttaceae bacterium]
SPLAKVFWKGEFEGKNLFFKKGFPLLIKLEKTSLKGSQLAGDLSFFNADFVRKKFSRKERKERKEMKGGNVVSEANVVTLCSKRT